MSMMFFTLSVMVYNAKSLSNLGLTPVVPPLHLVISSSSSLSFNIACTTALLPLPLSGLLFQSSILDWLPFIYIFCLQACQYETVFSCHLVFVKTA